MGDIGARKVEGSIWEGYTPRREAVAAAIGAEIAGFVRTIFPTTNADLDRETSRILAIFEDDNPRSLETVTRKLTAESHPVDDIHYLTVLARLRAPRTPMVTVSVAGSLLALDRKLAERQ